MLPIPTSERHGRFGAGLRGGRILLAAGLLVASLGACTNMSQTQQRTLSGGAIGAAGGAAMGSEEVRDRCNNPVMRQNLSNYYNTLIRIL